MVFFISGTVKATITVVVGELIFLKTQEMLDNLLKIEYFHLKTLLCIHYLCTNIHFQDGRFNVEDRNRQRTQYWCLKSYIREFYGQVFHVKKKEFFAQGDEFKIKNKN